MTPQHPNESQVDSILDHLTCTHHIIDKAGCVGCEPQAAIEKLLLEARIDELKGVYGDGTQHHFRVGEYIRKRIVQLEEEKNGSGQ